MNKEESNILHQRALDLAKSRTEQIEKAEQCSYVVFALQNENYGIESEYVQEIVHINDITAIPNTPDFFHGIINHRGKNHAIIDLKKLLGIPEIGLSEMNKVILLKNGQNSFGLLTDKILQIDQIEKGAHFEPPLHISELGKTIIKGINQHGITLLNGHELINCKTLIVNNK